MIIAACAVPLLFALLNLDDDINFWRNRRRNRYPLDWLRNRTGLSQQEIEARVGPRGPDRLYEVSLERLASLPRKRWLRLYHPSLNVASLIALAACMLASGPWYVLAAAAAYLVAVVVTGMAAGFREAREETPSVGPGKPGTTVQELIAYVRSLEAQDERDLREDAIDGEASPFWRWLFTWMNRRSLRGSRQLVREAAELADEYDRAIADEQYNVTSVRWRRTRPGIDERVASRLEALESLLRERVHDLKATRGRDT
jgi:hypothetical protein